MKESQLNRIAIALEHKEVITTVAMIAQKYELRLRDVTSFEYECYSKIGKAIMQYGTSIRNLTAYTKRICGKVAKVHLDRRSVTETISIDGDQDGNTVYEIRDVLANVEDAIIEKESFTEKAALLAQHDSRKMVVLNAWATGVTNDLELSRMLAHSLGGSSETHRSFIKRFKTKCQTKLAGIA